jgi:hypothetical protein
LSQLESFLLVVRLTEDLFQERSALRARLRHCFPDGKLPFNFVALALATNRDQSLTPRPSRYLLRSITRVEINWAFLQFSMAKEAARDLADKIEAQGTARLCAHCRARFHEVENSYCSPGCRKAANNRRSYRRQSGRSPA